MFGILEFITEKQTRNTKRRRRKMVVVNGWKVFGLGSVDRTVFGIVCFLLLSHLFLLMLVIQTVMYFVCKSYHREIVDKSALSYHLEVYECYEPLKAKDVQLDYHV